MKNLIANMDDILFVLEKQFKIHNYIKYVVDWKAFNSKAIKLALRSAKEFAVGELLPANKVGDEIGAEYLPGSGDVILPDSFEDIWNRLAEDGWIAMTEEPKLGGMGMPSLVAVGCSEYLTGANFAFMMYPGLARFVGRLLEVYGTKEQIDTYVEELYSGRCGGTMCLTEPQAGTDVGAVETVAKLWDNNKGSATKNPLYKLYGNKIFITNGEHSLTDNIVHPVLARIDHPDTPPGTRGISLFLVPKYLPGDGKRNRVSCTGIEEKMGIHGNGTCSMSFDGALGTLIGKPNEGMSIMFSMMNEARHMVALQALASASTAYEYALDYAKTRIQGRSIKDYKDHAAKSVAIINHPDVRRMLMEMKSYVEGMRSLVYYLSYCEDMVYSCSWDESVEEQKWSGLIDLLTPLAKGFCTGYAVKVVDTAMQVYGGLGYMKDYPIEQLYRDIRITPIYEGTNGVQAMDFIMRQMGARGGMNALNLMAKIDETIKEAKLFIHDPDVPSLAIDVKSTMDLFAARLGEMMAMPIERTALLCTPMLDVAGHLVLAWMHLWRATVGEEKHRITAKYFIKNCLRRSYAQMSDACFGDDSALDIKEKDF